MSRSTQYIRLGNLSSEDGAIQDGGQQATAHHCRPRQNSLRRPAIIAVVFLVSLILNLFLLGKVLFSNTTRDRILT